MTNSFAAERL